MTTKRRLRHEITSQRSTYTPTTATTSTSSSENLMIINTKIENATEGLSSNCFNYLSNRVLPASRQNALTICDYISSLRSEINPSDHYRRDTIILIVLMIK